MSRSHPSRYYIGTDKPVIIYPEEPTDFPGKLYLSWQLELEDADHLRIDEQAFDEDNKQGDTHEPIKPDTHQPR